MSVDIRVALPSDIPAVAAIFVAAETARRAPPDLPRVASFTGRARAAVAPGGAGTAGGLLVATHCGGPQAGRVCAAVLAEGARDENGQPVEGLATIVALMVTPELWGQAIGAALLDAALLRASSRGHHPVQLWQAEDNVRARRLYASRGFQPAGQPLRLGGELLVRLARG